jgi:site-specific recombinase XerC
VDQPNGYVFGTEAGNHVKSFKKSWQALFTLAGLDWGRRKGLTWHTTRHEFASRVCENEKDIKAAQEALRHARLETTMRYVHTRRDRRWQVAHGLNR